MKSEAFVIVHALRATEPAVYCDRASWVMLPLEKELGAELNQARRSGADHFAESGAVDIAIDGLRSEKLGMIENVEAFEAKLQRL